MSGTDRINLVEAIDAVVVTATVGDIRALIEKHREHVNDTNKSGWTVMRLIIDQKNDQFASEVVKLLLDLGADQTIPANKAGLCPIHAAARKGLLETVKVLVRSGGAMALRLCNKRGNTPAHHAGAVGDLVVLQYLISEGANPHLENAVGFTCYGKYFTRTKSDAKLLRTAALEVLQDAVHPRENVMALLPETRGTIEAAQALLDEMDRNPPSTWSMDCIWYDEVCRCLRRENRQGHYRGDGPRQH